MQTKRRIAGLLAATLLVGLCLGCATPGPREHFTDDFGHTYQQGFAAQTVNPEAGTTSPPVDTLPGEIAQEIYDNRYVDPLTKQVEQEDESLMREIDR